MLRLVTKSCLALCDPMDCSLPNSSAHGDSPGKNTRVDCHLLLQGIFPTQGLNPCFLGLLHLVGRFFNTVPPGKFIILSKVSQRKTNIIWYHLYAESKKKKMIQIELIYKTGKCSLKERLDTKILLKLLDMPWIFTYQKKLAAKDCVHITVKGIHMHFEGVMVLYELH